MMINHIMCTSKILTGLCFAKQRTKTKNTSAKVFYSVLVVKMSWKNIKKTVWGTIEFKNYFKQIPVPFKIYIDFECNLKAVEIYEGFYSKKYQSRIPSSFAYKIVYIDNKSSKPISVFRGENAAYEFIRAISEEYEYCEKIMKKHFNKNLIMSEEEEKQFQPSNTCWICEKLIGNDDEKVRDHCHITGKFRGAAHWCCNIFSWLKKFP